MVPDRTRALDILFCVLGSGLEWEHGQIVDLSGSSWLKKPVKSYQPYPYPFDQARKQNESLKDLGIYQRSVANTQRRMDDDNLQARLTRRYVRFYSSYSCLDKTWYPISKYEGYNVHAPKDIRPDWMEGLLECLHLYSIWEPKPLTEIAKDISRFNPMHTHRQNDRYDQERMAVEYAQKLLKEYLGA